MKRLSGMLSALVVLLSLFSVLPAQAADGRLGLILNASFSGNTSSAALGVTAGTGEESNVLFSAACTLDALCSPTLPVAWDWGDGTKETSSYATTHRFASPGVYTVTVNVQEGPAAGFASLKVYASPSYVDAGLSSRIDRQAVWLAGALGVFASCSALGEAAFCPDVSSAAPPGLVPPGEARANGLTGESCFLRSNPCALPSNFFTGSGVNRAGLIANGLLQENDALTYVPQNCFDGWTARATDGEWRIVPGIEEGCVSRGEFINAVSKALELPESSVQAVCVDSANTSTAGSYAALEALGATTTVNRGGKRYCDALSALSKSEAYAILASALSVPASPCLAGGVACTNTSSQLTRIDAAHMLSFATQGASSAGIYSYTETKNAAINRPVQLDSVISGYNASSVSVAWPASVEGVLNLDCPTRTLNLPGPITSRCTATPLKAGSLAVPVVLTPNSGTPQTVYVNINVSAPAPEVGAADFAPTPENTPADLFVPATDPLGEALTYQLLGANSTPSEVVSSPAGDVGIKEALPDGVLLTFTPTKDAHLATTFRLQVCSPHACTEKVGNAGILETSTPPLTPALITIGRSEASLTLSGSDILDQNEVYTPQIDLYEITSLPASGTLQIDADPSQSGVMYVPASVAATTNNPVVKFSSITASPADVFLYRVHDTGFPDPQWSFPGQVIILN